MKSFQQQMALRMLGVIIVGAILYVPHQFFDPQTKQIDLLVTSASACLLLGLWFACRYFWRYGRYAVLIALVLMTALARTEPNISYLLSLDIFLPTVMALLLGSLPWVIGSATATYMLLIIHAGGQGVYMEMDTLISYTLVIGGVVLARHVTDTAQRAAETSAQNALAQAQQLADKNDELRRRDAIMEAVGFAARRFLEDTGWHQHIQSVLQQLGTATHVSRVAVFENVADAAGELQAVQRHVWFVDGHAQVPVPREPRTVHYNADGLGRWADVLGHDKSIYGPRSGLPTAEEQMLARQNVQSLVVMPIFVRQSWWGFMSYVACDDERGWIPPEIEALKLAAGVLGAAIQRDDAEAALRKSEATNRALINAIPDLMMRMARSGVVLDVKAAKSNHLNLSSLDLIGRQLADFLPIEVAQTVLHANQQALRTGETQIFECALSVHGKQREYEAQVVVCGEDEVLAIVRDITERKNVDRMKTEFISVVSHELRTPLTSIRGALGLVTNGVAGEVPPQAQNMLEIARKNSERLVRLINDMLDIEKIGSGQMAFNLRPVAIALLVEQAVEANRAYGAQFGVRFDFSHTLADALVYADSDRLNQVFVNLLSNAAKFSPPGGTVYITVDRHDAKIRIAVTDCGPGIPVAFHASIFQRFAQADSSDTRQKEGTGLGLSIAKTIVDKHGGQLGFTTELGVGTTFFVDLAEWHAEQPTVDSVLPLPKQSRILVCEDDPDVAMLLTMMLRHAGFVVDVAHDAAQVRWLLARTRYDGMTLDLLLPDQDGLGLICELRAQPATQHLPIVVVSAHADEERAALNGDALEIVDWLNKPIQQDRLIAAVSQTTQQRLNSRSRILHIEDDRDVARVVASILQDVATVVWAATVQDAVAHLNQEQFDLILIDLSLPDGSGLDVLPLLNRNSLPAPVVIFSAQEPHQQTAHTIAATLTKSRTSNYTLLHTITELIARNRPTPAPIDTA